MIEFDYDTNKSKRNETKHGIDFHSAQMLWLDSNLIEIHANRGDEPRFLAIGQINKKHWSAVITYRNCKIRIISVRRSRTTEAKLYESESQNI